MVYDVVHNTFLNTLTMGTAFARVPPRNEPGSVPRYGRRQRTIAEIRLTQPSKLNN